MPYVLGMKTTANRARIDLTMGWYIDDANGNRLTDSEGDDFLGRHCTDIAQILADRTGGETYLYDTVDAGPTVFEPLP